MGDETGDDEALARALAAQEEEHAYALGVAYPTFRPPAKRRRPDPPGKTAQPKSPETATEPPSALLAKKQKVTVTLAHLIDYGVIVPGDDALATSYCDVTTTADLEADGTIVWRREKYRSVSAFSLAFKRSVKPDRKADDGWKCVRYVGVRDATGGGDESSVSQRGVDAVSDARAPMPAAADPDGDTLDALKRRLADDGSARAAAARRGDGAAVAAARARSDAERAAREAAKPPKQKPFRAKRQVKETRPFEPKVSKPPPRPKPDPKPKPPPPPRVDRPRRARKPTRRGFFGATSDLQMVECERYEADEQPWAVTCSFEALALMDFHAHLSSDTEIIGFLGGNWDAATKTLRVTRAFPARRLPSADAGVEVELDPASVPEIVDALERSAQRVVGWYHSHPTFATSPSLRDCENQSNYQALFAAADARERVPFVGAIVGPYRGADPVAEMTWFHVDADAGDGVLRDAGLGGQPREVRVDHTDAVSETPPEKTGGDGGDGVLDRLRRDAFALAEVFGGGAERFDRVDLDQPWGAGAGSNGTVTVTELSTGTIGWDANAMPSTRLTKMLRSLRARVARAAPAETTEAFVAAVAEKTRLAWRGEETRD